MARSHKRLSTKGKRKSSARKTKKSGGGRSKSAPPQKKSSKRKHKRGSRKQRSVMKGGSITYYIASGLYDSILQTAVNVKLGAGWKCQGGISVDKNGEYMQAMTKLT
jgi:hypothetical protein